MPSGKHVLSTKTYNLIKEGRQPAGGGKGSCVQVNQMMGWAVSPLPHYRAIVVMIGDGSGGSGGGGGGMFCSLFYFLRCVGLLWVGVCSMKSTTSVGQLGIRVLSCKGIRTRPIISSAEDHAVLLERAVHVAQKHLSILHYCYNEEINYYKLDSTVMSDLMKASPFTGRKCSTYSCSRIASDDRKIPKWHLSQRLHEAKPRPNSSASS